MKVLIIGGVAGGATAAARLRRLDENTEIVMLERGGYISFANCGLPYHVGDVISDREDLLLQTPEKMKAARNIDVRIMSEAVAIDPERKVVTVRSGGEEYEESYDELIIATGSSPLRPPIPGIDGPNINVLWNVDDVDRIKGIVDVKKPETAVVVGGGFIGLEMAENLSARGVKVSIAEALDQVMAPLDPEMAAILHKNIKDNGVDLYLGDGVSKFEENGEKTDVVLSSGTVVTADLVILSIGVRPNSELAKAAGIETNAKGGIVVDAMMKTNVPHIWAVGDVVEVDHFITGERTMIPLAGPANRQGRIAADNIMGAKKEYPGSMGTSVAQVYDMAAAAVGLNEKALKARGMEKNKDYYSEIVTQMTHAKYYPGAEPMFIKLLFGPEGNIFGAQAVGPENVDKRIDSIATAIALKGNIHDLTELQLSYAPPFSTANDPVNMAGFVAENILEGLVRFCTIEESDSMMIIDVRDPFEVEEYSVPGAVNIPLGEIRERMDEFPRDKDVAILCKGAIRAYNAWRALVQNGYENLWVLEGGTDYYKAVRG